MSYILDALQKSAAPANPDPLLGPAPPPVAAPTQLALHWKMAIAAVLLANVALVYRLMTGTPDLSRPAASAEQNRPAQPANRIAAGNPPSANRPPATQPGQKIPLPGIAAPRDLPPPTQTAPATAQNANNSAPRTFKPRGAPITIAEGFGSAGTAPQPAPPSQPPVVERSIAQRNAPPTTPPQRSNGVSRLSQLSEGARTALYVLEFSFHIYGSAQDLRAVVVNGERLQEGSSVTADNGQQFEMEEITDNGVIVRFEHDGAEQRVEIPVMEDWKDA